MAGNGLLEGIRTAITAGQKEVNRDNYPGSRGLRVCWRVAAVQHEKPYRQSWRGSQFLVAKIKVSGKSGSCGLVQRLRTLVCARVLAGHAIYLGLPNCTAAHGKEKVYGSIP